MIVDDDPVVLKVLRAGLEGAGLDVLEAADGAGALRVLIDHLLYLDLLVVDLNMPGIDGTALVRIIRAEGGEAELGIIVVTGVEPRSRSALLDRLGVSGVLSKSAGSAHIVEQVTQLASHAYARRLAADAGTPLES